MRRWINLRPVLMMLSIVTAACANDPVRSRLDSSGLTVVTLDRVIVLARPALELSTAARDYIYLGPVEINRMGERTHYVWLGMGSTVDRSFADEAQPRAASLALLVDGVPMKLPLTSWSMELDQSPYHSSVRVYDALAARASLTQIDRIAAATSVDVLIIMDTGMSAAYRKWRGQWSEWSAFSAQGRSSP